MNTVVRTTVTLPVDLYEKLRLQAFRQSTSFSGIVKQRLMDTAKVASRQRNFLSFSGKYKLGTKKFTREEIYDELIKRDMARGLNGSGRVGK